MLNVLNHFSDNNLPILFKLGTQIKNDGFHTHIIFFRDQIEERWLSGGHFSCKNPDIEHVLTHFSDMYLQMLFKLGTQITRSAPGREHTSARLISLRFVSH